MTAMSGTFEVVAVSRTFDLVALFREGADPRIRLVRPEEVSDPALVEYALCWQPEERAFDAWPALKLVSSIAAGVDSILACPSLRDDITVTRIRDQGQADLMAGFAAWNVVWHHRRMGSFIEAQARRAWERSFRPEQPGRVTVGVLGFGLMGRACAKAIAAMGYRVVAARSSAGEDPGLTGIEVVSGPGAIAEVAARSEILVNVLPLTDATRDVLNADLFARMPAGSALVHLGRGEQLVEEDLLASLDAGHIRAASIDVFRSEPPAPDHPFWARPEILITPHKASDSTRSEILRQLAENIIALRGGQALPGGVDRNAGY